MAPWAAGAFDAPYATFDSPCSRPYLRLARLVSLSLSVFQRFPKDVTLHHNLGSNRLWAHTTLPAPSPAPRPDSPREGTSSALIALVQAPNQGPTRLQHPAATAAAPASCNFGPPPPVRALYGPPTSSTTPETSFPALYDQDSSCPSPRPRPRTLVRPVQARPVHARHWLRSCAMYNAILHLHQPRCGMNGAPTAAQAAAARRVAPQLDC